MKSEEKSIKAISAQAHGEAADNRLLRKKLREKDELISDLRAQIENHERSKDVLVIVCFCLPFDVFMGFCFSRPAWPFCTQAQMS